MTNIANLHDLFFRLADLCADDKMSKAKDIVNDTMNSLSFGFELRRKFNKRDFSPIHVFFGLETFGFKGCNDRILFDFFMADLTIFDSSQDTCRRQNALK